MKVFIVNTCKYCLLLLTLYLVYDVFLREDYIYTDDEVILIDKWVGVQGSKSHIGESFNFTTEHISSNTSMKSFKVSRETYRTNATGDKLTFRLRSCKFTKSCVSSLWINMIGTAVIFGIPLCYRRREL